MEPQDEQMGAKERQQRAERVQKGPKMESKGSKREPKGSARVTKMHQSIDLQKRVSTSCDFRSNWWSRSPLKMDEKSMRTSIPTRLWKLMKSLSEFDETCMRNWDDISMFHKIFLHKKYSFPTKVNVTKTMPGWCPPQGGSSSEVWKSGWCPPPRVLGSSSEI